MDEIDIATITKRSIHGVFALVSRTFLIQLIGQIVTFLLTVYLSPSDYGVFFLVSAVIAFFSYFSDIGLAAALIQKKEELTTQDLRTTFTIQQCLVISVVIIGLALSEVVASFYKLDQQGVFLYQALLVAFFFSSLKTIPSILLERSLQFNKLVIPEIVETLLFNIIVLVMAMQGQGVTSFSYAVLARGFAGLVVIYCIRPWAIGFGFSKQIAKRLLSFGIPFQTNSILALLKDQLLIIYLGGVLTKQQLGYIGFAQKWAYMPLRLIMDNVIRITFPSFSRMSDNKHYLSVAIEKSIFAVVLLIFPVLTLMVLLMPYFFHLVPRYQKWEPAYLSLAFFAVNACLSSISTPLTNALNAIGKIKVTLYLMIFWTSATWILTPIAIHFFGFNGVALVSAFVAASVVFVIWLTRRYVPIQLAGVIFRPLGATVAMGVVIFAISPFLISNVVTLLLVSLLGAMIYLGFLMLLARKQVIADVKTIRLQLRQ